MRKQSPLRLASGDAFAHASIDFDTLDPFMQRLRHAADLGRDGFNDSPQR
jgi:hypothetical protein